MNWWIPKSKGGIVIRKQVRLILCILFSIAILVGCAKPTEMATLPPPMDTQVPPTKTQPQPTDTPVPLTPTLKSSPTKPALLVEPGKIVGRVDIGGRSLFIRCEGVGSPTIILEGGMGMNTQDWNLNGVYSDLTMVTRTCAYDRANMGASDKTPLPRTVQDMVNDLHTLLINANILGPYVLVGHSGGAWVVVLYAWQYPEGVVGMVLLDDVPPDTGLRMSAVMPTETPNESVTLTEARNYWATWYDWYNKTYPYDREGWDILNSAKQVRAVTSLGDMPLLVLTASFGYAAMHGGTGVPEINQMVSDTWVDLQQELAALSTNGRQITVPNSEHYIWLDEPGAAAISSEIRSFVRKIQVSLP